MYNYRHVILPLSVLAFTMFTVSCGSKRTVTRDTRIPEAVKEITLDDLVGKHQEPVLTDEIITTREARALIEAAHSWLGTPYKYGGETRHGVDCSAMVMNVYNEALNIKIPRTTRTQREYAMPVKRSDLQPGDLIFFSPGTAGKSISHVGLFIGNGRFIHASSSRGVVVSSLVERYYRDHYHSAGRIVKKPSREILITVNDNKTLTPKDKLNTDKNLQNQQEAARKQEMLDEMLNRQLELLDKVLTATIDSIYSMPLDDDPNLAPGL